MGISGRSYGGVRMPQQKGNVLNGQEETGRELLEAVTAIYEAADRSGKHPSLQSIADTLRAQGFGTVNPMKVRKLLITAGEVFGRKIYESAGADEVLALWREGKTAEEIQEALHLSRASVHAYLPYTKIIYKMSRTSPGAERERLCRDRKQAVTALAAEPTCERLWNAIVLFEGYPFKTSKGLSYTYGVKGGELFFSRKEKSITRATVSIAFQKALELGAGATGPKKLGVFGASYLYPVFLRLGVIPGKTAQPLRDDPK